MCSANMNNLSSHSTYSHHVASSAMNKLNGMECPQVSVAQIDEEEIPEEKMHSPRTPIGSLPDPVKGNNGRSELHFHFRAMTQSQQQCTMPTTNMQRTISASSADTSISFDRHSGSLEQEPVMSYASSLSAGYSVDMTPPHSACATPKAYPFPSLQDEKEQQEDNDDDYERKSGEPDRNSNIQAIHEVLTKLTAGKLQPAQAAAHGRARGFNIYKHGLGTYSNGYNSGVNTNGTATPASMEPLSRHSSCRSVGSDDASFEEEDSSESVDVLEVDQLANAPVYVPSTATINLTTADVDDELESPVPSDAEPSFVFRALPKFDVNAFSLAKIAEDSVVEKEQLLTTPNTVVTIQSDSSDKTATKTAVYDMIETVSSDEEDEEDDDDDDEEEDEEDEDESVAPVPRSSVDVDEEAIWIDLEDEIASKAARLQSSRVLFLDVDGVLLSVKEQSKLSTGRGVDFNPHVTALMKKLCRETQCDVIVSSTWQFYEESHMPPLIAFLCDCGWRRNQIHTLLSLLPASKCERDPTVYGREWYEESPYCYCRARGIQKIVSLYASHISRWCCLDDLPLHSRKLVCVPKAQDVSTMVERLAQAYFSSLVWNGVTRGDNEAKNAKLMAEISYCVKYAITNLPNALFCTQSYRFGYESNRTMIYYQSDAIAKLIKLSYELSEGAAYQGMIQSLMAVICDYVDSHLVYQGDPYIAPYLVQTDQERGITEPNIENAITLLTYPNAAAAAVAEAAVAGTSNLHQLNDSSN